MIRKKFASSEKILSRKISNFFKRKTDDEAKVKEIKEKWLIANNHEEEEVIEEFQREEVCSCCKGVTAITPHMLVSNRFWKFWRWGAAGTLPWSYFISIKTIDSLRSRQAVGCFLFIFGQQLKMAVLVNCQLLYWLTWNK